MVYTVAIVNSANCDCVSGGAKMSCVRTHQHHDMLHRSLHAQAMIAVNLDEADCKLDMCAVVRHDARDLSLPV